MVKKRNVILRFFFAWLKAVLNKSFRGELAVLLVEVLFRMVNKNT